MIKIEYSLLVHATTILLDVCDSEFQHKSKMYGAAV